MSSNEPTRVIAIRHGETAWNAQARIQGHADIPLNDTGRWQARRMAGALAHEDIAAIYSSDLLRASQTAEALAAQAGVGVVHDGGLRERGFGHFEGMTFADIEARWPEQALRWRRRDPAFAPEGGESLQDFRERCVAAARRLAAAHPGQAIALVAHGGVMDCLYRDALRIDLQAPRTWQLANAGINRLLHGPDGFTLVGWGDTLHLDGTPLDDAAEDGPPVGRSPPGVAGAD